MESGQYTSAARELARNLIFAGCSAGKVAFAVKSCARAFGIVIAHHRFMDKRTVGRAIDEGGKYGEIQLAREIMDAPGMLCVVSAVSYHYQVSLKTPTARHTADSPSSPDT